MTRPPHPLRDPQLLAAAGAGPLAWLALSAWLPLQPGAAAWPLLMGVLLMPVVEELVFRGLLQGWLLERRWGRRRAGPVTLANLLTAVAFGAAHLWRHGATWAVLVIGPGLVFGHFRERYGGIAVPMVLHAWYNAGFIVLFGGQASG